MKHLNRTMWILVACLALAAPLAWGQDDTASSETEVIGPGVSAPADGEAPSADGAEAPPADGKDGEGAEGEGEDRPAVLKRRCSAARCSL